jgi:hypothetical protein
MLLACKSGTISAAKLVNETENAWTLEVEKSEILVNKSDPRYRAFNAMSDALEWSRAEQGLIDHFTEMEAKKTTTSQSS